MDWIRLRWKLWLRKWMLIPSFCKNCGVDVRDFTVPDEIWEQIEPHIKRGHTLCYNCFCDVCPKAGLPSYWMLTK